MSMQLVTVKEKSINELFIRDEGLDPYVDEITNIVLSFNPDVSTNSGRKEIESLVKSISRSKTYLDNLRKDVVQEWKSKSKVADKIGKRMRDQLDDLKILARKPLTKWEDDIEKEKAIESLNKDHEFALLMNYKFDDDKIELEKIEKENMEEKARKEKEKLEELIKIEHERTLELVRIQKENDVKAEEDKRLKIMNDQTLISNVLKSIKLELIEKCNINEETSIKIVNTIRRMDIITINYSLAIEAVK